MRSKLMLSFTERCASSRIRTPHRLKSKQDGQGRTPRRCRLVLRFGLEHFHACWKHGVRDQRSTNALGLAIPPVVLPRADEVIE